MLQNIRENSQGWIAKAIIGVIVALMALTSFDAIFEATAAGEDVATVNGEEITQIELSQAIDMQRRQLMQQFRNGFNASLLDEKILREEVLKGLIYRKLLLQGANKSNFSFSETAMDQVILQTPAFQDNGQFSTKSFDQMIHQLGYSRLQFREMLGQEMLIDQLRTGLAGSRFATDEQVNTFIRLEKQTRYFAMLNIKADPAAVKLNYDEIRSYYDEHVKEFMSPDQVVIDYIELKKSAFFKRAVVRDNELQALYQKEIARLVGQRRAAHILIDSNDEQAESKIVDIQQRLTEGESFEELAKEFSEDPSSAANGGDLGFVGPGVYDPIFETAVYKLEKNHVSEPIRTSFGYHLIKLLDIEAPEVPSFSSLKDKLTRDLKKESVEHRFFGAEKQLEDSSFEASDLVQPAQELKLTVHTSEPFDREGGKGITVNHAVIEAAFSTEVIDEGANSAAIELDSDTVVVLRVKEHHKPELLPFEAVALNIRVQLLKERASAAAKIRAEYIIKGLRDGKFPLNKPVDSQSWQAQEAVTRDQEGIDLTVLQAVFRMPKPRSKEKPTFGSVILPDDSVSVLRLNSLDDGIKPTEEEKMSYRRTLAFRLGQQDFAAYHKQLESEAKVEHY